MDQQSEDYRASSSMLNESEKNLEAMSSMTAIANPAKTVEEIDEQFQKIKERLQQEKSNGSRTKLKNVVQSLNFDQLGTFGGDGNHTKRVSKGSGLHNSDQKGISVHPSKDFEEISLCKDQQQLYAFQSQRQFTNENGEIEDQVKPILNQGYAQSMMEKFSNIQDIEDQVTTRDLIAQHDEEIIHQSAFQDNSTLNVNASHAFKHSVKDLNQSIPATQASPEKIYCRDEQPNLAAEDEEDNILSRSSQKRQRRIDDDYEDQMEEMQEQMSSRSSNKDLAMLHDSLQRQQAEMVEIEQVISQKQEMRILAPQEVNLLSEQEKHDYITWLKEEIHNEQIRELKFKSLQDDLGLLHKNFALEKELNQSEQENRKLQIWILEDKQDQMQKQFEEAQIENEEVANQVKQAKQDLDDAMQKLQAKSSEIDQEKQQVESIQSDYNLLQQRLSDAQKETGDLQTELDQERSKLDEENQLKVVKNSLYDEKNSIFTDIESKFNTILALFAQKDKEYQFKEAELVETNQDIEEAQQIIEKLEEERDMFETQKSFLSKQNTLFAKEMSQKQQKLQFDQDFIMYGQKNNSKIQDEVMSIKTQIQNLKSEGVKMSRDTNMLKLQVFHYQNQIDAQMRINQIYDGNRQDNTSQDISKTTSDGLDSFAMRSQTQRPSNTDSKNQSSLIELIAKDPSQKDLNYHMKSKSIQQNKEHLQKTDKLQSSQNEISGTAPREFVTWRESNSITEESNKPLNLMNSVCSNTNQPMTQEALKKFLDNKYQGLRHPQQTEQTQILQRIMTMESQQSTETLRTQEDNHKMNDATPFELKPRDIEDSQSNAHKNRPSNQSTLDYGQEPMKIQQNNYKYDDQQVICQVAEEISKQINREKLYDMPRKTENKDHSFDRGQINERCSEVTRDYQANEDTNIDVSKKYQKFFTSKTGYARNDQCNFQAQKTERDMRDSYQNKQFIDMNRNKSTDAKSDMPLVRHQMKAEQLVKYEPMVDHNRSFNLSQMSRIGSDVARPEPSTNQVDTDYQQQKPMVPKDQFYFNNQQTKGTYQRSDRSKEREAILKQTQELIKKSQDRLRWHQTENKNFNANYKQGELQKEQIKSNFELKNKSVDQNNQQNYPMDRQLRASLKYYTSFDLKNEVGDQASQISKQNSASTQVYLKQFQNSYTQKQEMRKSSNPAENNQQLEKYKSKYQTGDINTQVKNFKAYNDNSFENRSQNAQKRKYFGDTVSQGSTDNILLKRQITYKGNMADVRPSRSKDEVAPQKRTASQSSQFKSRAAMRVLGITQAESNQFKRATQTIDVNDQAVSDKPSNLISSINRTNKNTVTDPTPEVKHSVINQNYRPSTTGFQYQSRNFIAQGTEPNHPNEKKQQIEMIQDGFQKRRKSEYMKNGDAKRNHSSYSAIELLKKPYTNLKQFDHLANKEKAPTTPQYPFTSQTANNLRYSYDMKNGQNYQVRFESNENSRKFIGQGIIQATTKSVEGRYNHANMVLQKNQVTKDNDKATQPDSGISLKKQNANHLNDQALSNFDDAKSTKSYCPISQQRRVNLINHDAHEEPRSVILKKRMIVNNQGSYTNQSSSLHGLKVETDLKSEGGAYKKRSEENTAIGRQNQKTLFDHSATSILKEELRSEHAKTHDNKADLKGYNDSLHQQNQMSFDNLKQNMTSQENSLRQSMRSILKEEKAPPKQQTKHTDITKYSQSFDKTNVQMQKQGYYKQDLYQNQERQMTQVYSQINYKRYQPIDQQTRPRAVMEPKDTNQTNVRSTSRSPDNILGFKSRFAQKQFTDQSGKQTRNDIQIQDQKQIQRVNSNNIETQSNYAKYYNTNLPSDSFTPRNKEYQHIVKSTGKFACLGNSSENVDPLKSPAQFPEQNNYNQFDPKTKQDYVYKMSSYDNQQKFHQKSYSENKDTLRPSFDFQRQKIQAVTAFDQAKQNVDFKKYTQPGIFEKSASSNYDIPMKKLNESEGNLNSIQSAYTFKPVQLAPDQPTYQSRIAISNQKVLQTEQRTTNQPASTSRNLIMTPDYDPNGTGNMQNIKNNIDDIRETKIQRQMYNKTEEPELKYTSKESVHRISDKNDSIEFVSGPKEYNFFKPMDSQAMYSPQLQTCHLGSTNGQVLTPYLKNNNASSLRSTEKSNVEHHQIGSMDQGQWRSHHLPGVSQIHSATDTQKELNLRKESTNQSLFTDTQQLYNGFDLKKEEKVQDERQQRSWGNFKSSFAKREMSRGDSNDRVGQIPASAQQQNIQIVQNKNNYMEMPMQYVPTHNQSVEHEPYAQNNIHTFNRRQYEDQPKSLNNSANQHQFESKNQISTEQTRILDQEQMHMVTPKQQVIKIDSRKATKNDPMSQESKNNVQSKHGQKLSQFLMPNPNQQNNKVETSSLANITEQVITGNIKDYKQQQSQQILKMQQELQQMHKDQSSNLKAEPNTAVPIGYKRKGSQDYTLDLSMEDKLSEYMQGNKKGAGVKTPYVIHQQPVHQNSVRDIQSDFQMHTMTIGTQRIPETAGILIGQTKQHVEFDSDNQSSMLFQGSGLNSHGRFTKMTAELAQSYEENSQERVGNNLQETVNLSLEEQADIITQLRSSKSQRGKIGI